MQDFFNDSIALAGGQFSQARWRYAHAGLERNLGIVTRYYNYGKRSTRNEHFLVRLLRSLNVNMSMPLDRFVDVITNKALFLGRSFRMTSTINAGALHKGVFYGQGSYEIIWAVNHSFPYDDINTNWKKAKPIQVLLHTKSDLDMMLPDGTGTNLFEGVSVVTVNIPMLAVMYRAFCQEQWFKGQHGDGMETAAMFVNDYVLPSMLGSQLDMSLFNRFLFMARGMPQTVNRVRHAVHVPSYTADVDQFFMELLEYLEKSPKSYANILQLIPAFTEVSMFDVLRLPDVAMTRQVTWAMLLSRIDAIDLLTLVAPDSGRTRNQADNNYFLREFKLMENNRIVDSLPEEVRLSTVRKISDIKARIAG